MIGFAMVAKLWRYRLVLTRLNALNQIERHRRISVKSSPAPMGVSNALLDGH